MNESTRRERESGDSYPGYEIVEWHDSKVGLTSKDLFYISEVYW